MAGGTANISRVLPPSGASRRAPAAPREARGRQVLLRVSSRAEGVQPGEGKGVKATQVLSGVTTASNWSSGFKSRVKKSIGRQISHEITYLLNPKKSYK